ncbi:MAG: hypothetical protein GKS07_10970 [Nitrosopumilus sp.]|nr:MAG: hypothetical protein GKS07_00535 [Nitrosopumilus sp.]QMU55363.1 MAG: hypothetical protein GKS07_10970 [Nitrosopumilus sp.]
MKPRYEKIYGCTECKKRFAHPRALCIHLKMAHNTNYKIKILDSSYACRVRR